MTTESETGGLQNRLTELEEKNEEKIKEMRERFMRESEERILQSQGLLLSQIKEVEHEKASASG